MCNKGILIVVSGFSGAGKGTVVKKLVDEYDYSLSISATTRSPRYNEKDGEDYFFTQKESFEDMIDKDELLEYANYCGNYYGTPKKFVEKQLEEGKNVILEIEVQGALKVKEKFQEALLIFITTPTVNHLKERLINRGTESIEVVNKRLFRAKEEVDLISKYDFVVTNSIVDECAGDINKIIYTEHKKADRNIELIKKIKREFETLK